MKTRKIFYFISTMLFSVSVSAQIGIGGYFGAPAESWAYVDSSFAIWWDPPFSPWLGLWTTNYSLSNSAGSGSVDVNSDGVQSSYRVDISGKGDADSSHNFTYGGEQYIAADVGTSFSIYASSPVYFSIVASATHALNVSGIPSQYTGSSAGVNLVFEADVSVPGYPKFLVGNLADDEASYENLGNGPPSGAMFGIIPANSTYYFVAAAGAEANDYYGTNVFSYSGSAHYAFTLTLSLTNIPSTTLSGRITDAHSGLPIIGATVQIGYVTAMSDTNGYYSQSNLPPATYTVTANANNYVSQTNAVTTSSSQTNVTQNFALSPLPKLDYFGVGVNWAPVTAQGSIGLRGDINASNLYNAFQTDLPSVFNQGTSATVPLSASSTSLNNLNTITAQFNQFKNGVYSNDTIVFYVDTHAGLDGALGIQISLASDYNNNPVFAGPEIADLLNSLPSSTRKVVILDCCHAGGIANYLVGAVPNASALAASSGTLEYIGNIIYGGTTPYYNDGTSVFTDALIVCLNNGVFGLNQIAADIYADAFGMYVSVIGQNLNLEDTGSAIFTGLQPQLWEGPGFTGNLASNTVTVVQSPPKVLLPKVVNGSFQMTLTNVPSSGSIAIEVSTNLNSWLQVAFSQAAGTNLNYSFSVTNAPQQFFRTKVVP